MVYGRNYGPEPIVKVTGNAPSFVVFRFHHRLDKLLLEVSLSSQSEIEQAEKKGKGECDGDDDQQNDLATVEFILFLLFPDLLFLDK